MIDKILSICSVVCGVSVDSIKGKNRARGIVVARQIYCYILRKHFRYGLVEIAKTINKDHTTVIHSCRLVENLIAVNDPQMVEPYEAIMAKIKEDSKSEIKLHIMLSDLTNPNILINDIVNRYNCSVMVISEEAKSY